MSTCTHCHTDFTITEQDHHFYQSFDVPNPKLCPDCRLQQRMVFRNERSLYQSTCTVCHKSIIAIYAPEKGYTVLCPDCWWANKYDPLAAGRSFDFSKTLSEQLADLYRAVPHVGLYTTNCTNSDYNNFGLNLNNCYLLFGASNDEHCLYGKFVIQSLDTVDALSVFSTELCYEAVASERCYHCLYVTNSRDCRDCLLISDCQTCTDCIGCVGLHNKKYYVFNQDVGEQEYKKILQSYYPLTINTLKDLQTKFDRLKKSLPQRASHIYASENCSGDLILNSVNCQHCFDIKECENCKFVSNTPNAKDCYDAIFSSPYGLEHCYLTCSTTGVRDSLAVFMVWNSYNTDYSLECHQSHDLFGCVSLQKQQFCILNKQYAEQDYNTLRAKVINHLKETGEWGEYLNPQLSPFGYNETIAQEYFPLEKSTALSSGYTWYDIPDKPMGTTVNALLCKRCKKQYRLVKEELAFYQKARLPLPELCPDCRRTRRLQERGPYHLWTRQCNQCHKTITTNYAPERAAVVYCESCYREEMY